MSSAPAVDDEMAGFLDDLGDCVAQLNAETNPLSEAGSAYGSSRAQELTDFLNRPIRPIERRRSKRKLGVAGSATSCELGDYPLDARIKALADHCFPDATYKLGFNESSLTKLGDVGNAVAIDITYDGSDYSHGKVEFNFGFNFKKNLTGTAVFIQEIARYVGADLPVDNIDIVKLAFWKAPYLLEKDEGMYHVSFEFEKGRTAISFRQSGACGAPVLREYLDPSEYNFTLAKSNEEYTHIIFERYPGQKKVFVDDDLPDEVVGPDGKKDNVYATPGCLEHYAELSDEYMLG